MKAIETRFLGPTDTKGSRYVADDGDGNRVIVSADHSLSAEGNHESACVALLRKMNWRGTYRGGYTSRGMAWVDQNGLAVCKEL